MAEEKTKDQEFVEYVVKSIVDKPDKVNIKRRIDEMGVLIELGVDRSDMGKVIGKNGQNAQALRTLLRVVGAKNNARVNLKILEPGRSEDQRKENEEKDTSTKMDDVPSDVIV